MEFLGKLAAERDMPLVRGRVGDHRFDCACSRFASYRSGQVDDYRGSLHCMEPGDAKSPLTQLRRGVIEFCVLSLLELEPMYAVDLVKRLGEVNALATTEGTMYPLLSRLRRDGVVSTEWQESTSGPPRRYYSITPSGLEAIREFRSAWDSFVSGVDLVLGIEGRRGR